MPSPHSLVRPFPIPSQPAKDLNSNHTFLSTFAKSKPNTHQALHFSFCCSPSSPTCSAEKLFTFIFTPSLYLPPAGSGNSAQRAETKHDTHTAHSHYTSNFPQKGTFDINQPTSLSSPSLTLARKKTHTDTHTQRMARVWPATVPKPINPQHTNRDNNAKQNTPSPVVASVGGVSLARQFPWQRTGDSPVCDAVAVTTCGVLHHYGSGEHCGCLLSWVIK